MKFILMIVAACAALLFALPAEAKLFHRNATEVQVAVSVAPVMREAVAAKPQAVVVDYQQGTRRLNLRERIRARVSAGKAIRAMRVSTLEAVVAPPSSETLGIESSGAGE